MKFNGSLDKAIKSEGNVYKFYKVFNIDKYPNAEQELEMFSMEEMGHKKILRKVILKEYVDLKLSDHLSLNCKINNDPKLHDMLKVTIASEKGYSLYEDLMYNIKEINSTLKLIASQELNHKAKLENIYDELFYKEF